jgi:hypothetical protein
VSQPAEIAERILASYGSMLALELPSVAIQSVLEQLWSSDRVVSDNVDIRIVVGSACTTAARAVEHLVAALQLPYSATTSLDDVLDALLDRPSALRQIVMIGDAARFLVDEPLALWHRVADRLVDGHRCMGGGWSTLVLIDSADHWRASRFGAASAVPIPGTLER